MPAATPANRFVAAAFAHRGLTATAVIYGQSPAVWWVADAAGRPAGHWVPATGFGRVEGREPAAYPTAGAWLRAWDESHGRTR